MTFSDQTSNEDSWDLARTDDNRLALCKAAINRPNPKALADDQLTWEQFMDANRLMSRWLTPSGWPEEYVKVLTLFFWQLENHEDKMITDGQETLLLYQARVRMAWHNELKAGHFFNLAKINKRKINAFRKEVDGRYLDRTRKAVSSRRS